MLGFGKTIAVGVCAVLPMAAHAQQEVGETTIGGGVSIFGPLVEGTYMFEPNLRVRGVLIGGWDFDTSETDDNGNTFDIDLDPAAAAILIDHYPSGSGWRFSGGLLFDLSEVTAIGRPSATDAFEFNGETFDTGRVEVEGGLSAEVAPMVTAGYEYPLDAQWTLSGEIGAIYAGGFSATAEADNDLLQDAIDNDEDFQDALSEANSITILPYISVAVSFRF